MIEKFFSTISSFDLFKANPTLRFKGKSFAGSLFLGIFSFILIGIFVTLLGYQIRQALNYSEHMISYSQFQQKPLQGEVRNFMFAIKFSSDQLDYEPLLYENYYSIYAQYWSVDEQLSKIVMLKPCQLQQWIRLGTNYSNIFMDQNLRKAYCPPFVNGLNITVLDINHDQFMKLTLSQCNPALNDKCMDRKNIAENLFPQKNFHNFRMQIVMLVERPSISQQMPSLTLMTKILTKTPFSSLKNNYQQSLSFTSFVEIQLSQFQTRANDGINPFISSYEIYKGHSIAKSSQILVPIKDKFYPATFLSCRFSFNQSKKVYSRSVFKLDEIISYIGGLLEIIFGILALFIGKYNELKYQLSIGGSFFNYNNEGQKVRSKDLNIWTYTKVKFFKIMSTIFCLKPNWTQTKQIIETIQQSEKGMDVKRLFRRLEYLQKIIDYEVKKDLLKSMSLLKPMTLSQIQEQRKIMSYYPVIMKQKQPTTPEDAITQNLYCVDYLKRKQSQNQILKKTQTDTQKLEKQKEQINKFFVEGLGLDRYASKSICQFPIITKNAQKIHLTPQFQKVEQKITQAFLNVDPNQRKQLIMKVPILILHRIRMKAAEQSSQRMKNYNQNKFQQNFIQDKGRKITLKRKIKKKIKQFFINFDLFSVQPILRTDQKPEKKTAFFGCLNFIFICIFTYVFFDLVVKMFHLDPSKLTIYKYGVSNNNLRAISNIMIAFRFAENQYTQKYGLYNIMQQFNFTYTQFRNYSDYGEKDEMVPCQPDMWNLLGQRYYEYFEGSLLSHAYCLKNPLNFTRVRNNNPFFKINTTNRKCFLNQSIEQLQYSDSIASFDCLRFLQYYKAVIAQHKNFPIWVYILIPEVRADLPNPIVYSVKQLRIPVYKNRRQLFQAYLVGTRVITYNSMWPFKQTKEEKNQFAFNNLLMPEDRQAGQNFTFILRLSIIAEVRVTERRVRKIDDAFSYVGGLFGFLIFFFSFFFESYNQYRYELNVGENSFNYDTDGQKFSQKNLNGIQYIKYSILKWMKDLCCCKPGWASTNRMDLTLEQVTECLDTDKIFRRIQFIQKIIWDLYDKDFLLILTLTQHQNISQIRRKRKIMQYYDEIVQHKPAASVQDAVNQSIKSFKYLYQPVRDMVLSFKGASAQLKQQMKSLKKNLSLKEQIKKSLIDYLQLSEPVSRAISEHPQIAKQASQIRLSQQWDEIEQMITFAFLALTIHQREQITMKMPIIILHRIRVRAQKIKKIGQLAYGRYDRKQLQVELQSHRKFLHVHRY